MHSVSLPYTIDRYRTIEDGLKRENPVIPYIREGNLIKINPEYANAPFEDVIVELPKNHDEYPT